MNKRFAYKLIIIMVDFASFFLISVLAAIIFSSGEISNYSLNYYLSILVIIIAKILFNFVFKNYSLLWMYSIEKNLLKYCVFVALFNVIIFILTLFEKISIFTQINSWLYFIIMLLEFVYIVISRYIIAFWLNNYYDYKKIKEPVRNRTLIIGAGDAGSLMQNEIGNAFNSKYKVVGFVDDSPIKIGTIINNVKVFGPINDINAIVKKLNVKNVVIALPSIDSKRLMEITNIIEYKDLIVEILPDKSKLLQTDLTSSIRRVEIADLLGRHEISLNNEAVTNFYKDKVVLVTGGGGSIGSELCRQIAKMQPKKLVILDIYENCAYEIQQELKFKYKNDLDLQVEIVSITNRPAMDRVFAAHKPNIVVMAAAHKHVPLMEHNVIEAVENNVFGTLNTVEMAEKYGADRVHMVSTDKAVNPTSIMGATKRICEMIVQAHSTIKQHTTFSITRFGNVLGSAGSVIPLFKRQIEAGGPITLTDYRIIRYFMTIPEASQLVLTSSSMAKNGELFVLDMGQPVKIYDLALNMIKLSGLEYKRDIDIIETGLRPGEKLYEELLVKTEELDKTDNELIFIERDKPLSLEEIASKLEKLSKGIKEGNDAKMKEIIKSVVPTFKEQEQANKNFNGKEVK